MTPGIVYRKFKCGCMTPEPSVIIYAKVDRKKKKLTVCPICRTETATYLETIRACVDCGKMDTSHRGLSGERCRECSRIYRGEKRAKKAVPDKNRYYQAGQRIAKPEKLASQPMCRHRVTCLPMGCNDHLHCGDCPMFEREDLTLIYDRRDYDPYELAECEAEAV
jgi:hypothetical protein